MELLSAYIPMDRRQALARGESLPDRTSGAALFADISGFTPLTEALLKELGPRRGADELTRHLNLVYDALIAEVDRYGGSVVGFSGDAITCWFDSDPSALPSVAGQAGLRATACSLAMQQAMRRFATVKTPSGGTVSLAMKAAVAGGPVRRFLVGDPHIQVIDVLAGATLDRMAEAEHYANKGEVVLGAEVIAQIGDNVEIAEWRGDAETGKRFGVVAKLARAVEVAPSPMVTMEGMEGTQGTEGTEAGLRAWLLPPVYERLTTGQGQFLAEIRPAVALFLKFGGIDYDGDEAAGAKLDAYVRWTQNVLRRYEGYLLDLTIGDKGSYFYGVFGAPLAHDDDPARAVAAALELRLSSPELDFISGAQIGISRGRMRTGAYGGSTRRTYGVLGDAVNLAARLMSQAEPGQILVSQDIAEATAQSYNFKSIGPIPVKGKQEPVPVAMVLDRRSPSAQRSVGLFTHSLVGRDAELARMEQILESVLTGEGQIIRLEGEPGAGKSHLATEFVKRAKRRGLRGATGICQSISQNIPYSPWRQIFRTVLIHFGFQRAELESQTAFQSTFHNLQSAIQENPNWLLRLPLLGDLLGLPIPDNITTATFEPRLRQEALFALVVELIQSWAKTRPLLFLIDDAHWMDEASLGLTLALSRVIFQAPVLLLLTQRRPLHEDKPLLPELDQLTGYHYLNLNELSPEGIAALVANRLQARPSALALSLIQAQAQGNPFFTEELVDALREAGNLQRQADGAWTLSEAMFNALHDANCLVISASGDASYTDAWMLAPNAQLSAVDLGIPDSIHGVVLSRIDRLPEAHKATLKVASVIGRAFELDLLAQAHPAQPSRDTLLGQIELLETRDFAHLETPPPRLAYMFKHNITQEVAYETLLEAQQRELHQTVANALEGLRPDVVEQLAYHYSRSGVRHKMMFYLDKAARKAQREYANETALNYYSQALALEERWEWRKGQVEISHILGRRAEEQVALRTLEGAPSAPVSEVAYLWGQYHEAVGDYAEAQAAIERALEACRDRADVPGEVRCLSQLGLIARRRGDYDSAKAWYSQALAFFHDEITSSDEEAQVFAQALNGLGIVHRQQGNFDEAKKCYEQALTVSRKSGNRKDEADALNSLGVTASYQRSFVEALAYHRQALEIRRVIGDRTGVGGSLISLAQVVRDAGDYGQAQEYFAEALTIQQVTGNR